MAMEKGRLHKLVEGRSLPSFARDLSIRTWAEFFLKYVLSNRPSRWSWRPPRTRIT